MLLDQVVWRLVSRLLSRLAAKAGLLPEAPATDSLQPHHLQRVLNASWRLREILKDFYFYLNQKGACC